MLERLGASGIASIALGLMIAAGPALAQNEPFRIVNGAQPQERVAHELDTVIDDAAVAGEKQATPASVNDVFHWCVASS